MDMRSRLWPFRSGAPRLARRSRAMEALIDSPLFERDCRRQLSGFVRKQQGRRGDPVTDGSAKQRSAEAQPSSSASKGS